MRYPEPDHKTIYVRYHTEVMKMLDEIAKSRGVRLATVAADILSEYMRKIKHDYPTLILREEDNLGFSKNSPLYFLVRGRSNQSVRGKPMNLTIDINMDRDMQFLADNFDIPIQDFRTSVFVTYYENKFR